MQLQECNQKAEGPGGSWANSCSPLRPKAQFPLTSLATRGLLQKRRKRGAWLKKDRGAGWCWRSVSPSPPLSPPACPWVGVGAAPGGVSARCSLVSGTGSHRLLQVFSLQGRRGQQGSKSKLA